MLWKNVFIPHVFFCLGMYVGNLYIFINIADKVIKLFKVYLK